MTNKTKDIIVKTHKFIVSKYLKFYLHLHSPSLSLKVVFRQIIGARQLLQQIYEKRMIKNFRFLSPKISQIN